MINSEASSGVQPQSPEGRAQREGLTPEVAERPSLAPPKTTFSGDASPARGLPEATAFQAVCCPACSAVFALNGGRRRAVAANSREPAIPPLLQMVQSGDGSPDPVPFVGA